MIEIIIQQINALELKLPLYSFFIATNLFPVFVNYSIRHDLLKGQVFETTYLALITAMLSIIFSSAIHSKTLAVIGIILIILCYCAFFCIFSFLLYKRLKRWGGGYILIKKSILKEYEEKIKQQDTIIQEKIKQG